MDYIGHKYDIEFRRLACLVVAGSSLLLPAGITLADSKGLAAGHDAGLNSTVMDLDALLADQEAVALSRNSLAQNSTVPPLETLLDEEIRPAATETKVITSESGSVTVTGPAAKEAAVDKAPEVTERKLVAEAPVAPIETGVATPPLSAEPDPIIADVPPEPLPPALNNLPNLPPLESGAGDSSMDEPPPDLFAGEGNNPEGNAPTASISTNVTINLISMLVERGVLTQGDAAKLIQVAHAEAELARQTTAQQGMADDGSVRVTYIPEVVKQQIRDEVRADVMAQAKAEGWAAPDEIPDWLATFEPFGDLRLRYEYVRFPEGNDNTGAFPNFNAINTGSPFDVSGLVFSPQQNVDADRQRLRIRMRLGTEINLSEGFSGGVRLATGESNSPVSPNQTLGASGGNFSKYAIWVDRAFIKYEIGQRVERNLAFTFGRFDNPFFNTDIVWDDDLGFDGVAVSGHYQITKEFTPFIAGGIFPVYNTDFNFSSNQPSKFESDDKWLYGAQIGFDWKIDDDITLKLAASYFDYENIEGRLSTPYVPLTSSDAGDTDATRPSFAQKGNTYRPLRNIIASPLNDFGTSMQYQYFGLATPFRELAFTGRLEINSWEPVQISLVGEYVKNLDFNQEEINAIAVNNRGPSDFATGAIGEFDGGDTAWFAGVQFGKEKFEKKWDWNATFGYRYVESDAVVDAFTDSDFGGGGTNMKGFFIGSSLALSPNVKLGLRWMSADEVAGPPLKNDTIQIDLSAKF